MVLSYLAKLQCRQDNKAFISLLWRKFIQNKATTKQRNEICPKITKKSKCQRNVSKSNKKQEQPCEFRKL